MYSDISLVIFAEDTDNVCIICEVFDNKDKRKSVIYSVNQKSSPLKLFAVLSLPVNLCN